MVALSSDAHATISAWLSESGVDTARRCKWHGDSLRVHTAVAIAEKLFQTELQVFQRDETGERLIRQWGELSVPSRVAELIAFVEGLTDFALRPVRSRHRHRDSGGGAGGSSSGNRKIGAIADKDIAVVPQTLQRMYSLPANDSKPVSVRCASAQKRAITSSSRDYAGNLLSVCFRALTNSGCCFLTALCSLETRFRKA